MHAALNCNVYRKLKLTASWLQASLDFKLDLPQVAVIGSQSSGKSSVLEALVSHRHPATLRDNTALLGAVSLTMRQGLSIQFAAVSCPLHRLPAVPTNRSLIGLSIRLGRCRLAETFYQGDRRYAPAGRLYFNWQVSRHSSVLATPL